VGHSETGIPGKKKPMIKITSISIAGILVASIVTALSLSSGNANPFLPLQTETMVDPHNPGIIMHTHVQLEIMAGGMKAVVPANIGIDPKSYKDHSLDQFGVRNPQMAPIHTHGNEGLLHIESTMLRDYTMEDFMNIWGMNLDDVRTITMTVDGKPVPDYRSHILKDGQKITLEIGP
jgi:hypothetical protein